MKRPHWLHMRLSRLFRSRKSERVQKAFVIFAALYIFGQVIVTAMLGRFVIGGR